MAKSQARKRRADERARDDQSRAAARAHKIIAECSHVLVRASDERQLLLDMCRIAVESGGYLVAWVGLVRHDEAKTIEPVASAGDRDNYLGSIKLSWGDNEFGRGPAGTAVRTGKPQAVRDVRTNPAFAAWREKALARGFQVLAALPLVREGETLGVFGIFAGESTALDSSELELLGELARDIAYGIHTLRARDAQQRAEKKVRTQALQQRLIAEFGQQALANTDLDGVLNRAVELVSTTLKAEYCNVLELDPDGRRLRYKAAAGWPKEWIGRREVPVDRGSHMEYILSLSEPLVVEDYSAETNFSPSPLLQFGVRSSMQVPILKSTGAFGIMSVHTTQRRRFTEDEVNFLQSVANLLAVAIERKHAEERLAYLAQFDSLTGLPNRHLFHDRLVHTIAQAKRSGRSMAVLFIDLDRFKLVNDTLGHHAGDKLLKETAVRLAQCVRGSDTVGRFSGDEFGAIVSDLSKPGDASLVAEKIIAALARPYDLDGHETFISASVGITLFPNDAEEAGALTKNADVAMYRAKEQGRNNYQYFTREMNERALDRVHMEVALRRAIERREFLLHYQPKVDLKTGAICGLEALLRWQHPEKGLVSPAAFIPVLEDTGLIVPVGEWVMREVCAQIRVWQRQGLSMPVAVNLSARQFQQKELEDTVRRVLQTTGVAASLLEFELTESMLMKDPEAAARTLRGLKEAGVKLSVDDFGTGYSSLAYLKRFPIDALKIDRAFIRDVTVDPDDAVIAQAIIGLGHSLKLKVIAEGVETEAQLDFLSTHHCNEIQGFYFARPLPVADCTLTLTEGRRLKVRPETLEEAK